MNIREEIKEYLRGYDNCGALLLTGSWGSGKSHLIKDMIADLVKEESYAIAMISLFGIDDSALLNERIRDKYLEETSMLWGESARKTFRALHKVAAASAKITAAALPASSAAAAVAAGVSSVSSFSPLNLFSVKNIVGTGDKERKFILVFDDLERCGLPYQVLLGVINEYTENRKIHTILIADEEHISQETQKDYIRFKEKIVFRTIKLIPDYEAVIRAILKEYKDSLGNYHQFLHDNFSTLLTSFAQSGYQNFRTLKACIFDFRRVYATWKEFKFPDDDLKRTFYNFCAMTYECKNGYFVRTAFGRYSIVGKSQDKEENKREESQIRSKYMAETFDNIIYTMARWIVDGDWVVELFVNELNNRYSPAKQSSEDRFIYQLFWDLEQEDIDDGLPILLHMGYEGNLDCNRLMILLQKIHLLRKNAIPLPCKVNYHMLEAGFAMRKQKLRDGHLTEPKRQYDVARNEIDEDAKSLYESIKMIDNQLSTWKTRRMFLQFITGQGNVSAYDIRDKYMDCFDDDFHQQFFSAFKNASNQLKREMCLIFIGMDFRNEGYSSCADQEITKQNMLKLHAQISSLLPDITDRITLGISNSFIKNLDNQIKAFDGEVTPEEMGCIQDNEGAMAE